MSRNIEFLKDNLIAHRGLYDKENPENSIGAFKKAIANNYTIELDIHLTKDNKIVVFHDDNLKRMAGIDKDIKLCEKSELDRLYLSDSKYTIPTLEMVLNLVDGRVPILIEIKYDNRVGKLERKLVEILDNYKGEFAIQSFRISSIMWFRLNRVKYIRGLLISSKHYEVLDKYWIFNILGRPDFLSCDYKLGHNKKIRDLRDKILILGWTIKNKEEYNNYKDYFDNFICENIEDLRGEDNDRYRDC